MKEQEIIEGNKLIAEFMGWSKSTYSNLPNKMYKENGRESIHIDNLEYHSSWDWLMPVVEKIYNSRYHIKIEVDSITIANNNHYLSPIAYRLFTPDKLIEALWSSIVEFIKWYNQQKQKP